MIGDEKEVFYNEYCKTCKHEKEPEDSDVCNDCLNNPAHVDSHKPVRWEKK